MPATVLQAREVSLNGTPFPIIGEVKSDLSSVWPEKQVIGDYTRDSQSGASVLALSDWRGGIGLARQRDANQQFNRSWWSTCQQRYHEHLVLPPLAVQTAASGVSGSFTIGAMGELASEIYAAFGTSVRKYNNTTDSWGSNLKTLPATATDALTFRLGGTTYLAFATSGGYTYTSDGSSFTDDTTDTQFLAWWDDRLWGIDSTGQLWYSLTIGTEVNDAQLPLPNSSVNRLFVGRLPNGEFALHAGTVYGLYAHNADEARWEETDLALPPHPDNGKGATRWRDANYYSAGNPCFRYGGRDEQAGVFSMGPDRDDGLPSDKRGYIRQLVPTVNELLAIFDATSAPGSLANFDTEPLSEAEVISQDTGFSHILGWDTRGWEVKWLSGDNDLPITYALVSYAYSTYRLWWAHNLRVYYMALPRDILNPSEITTFAYAASGEHETPWFNADQLEVEKLALSLKAEVTGASSTETVTIAYALNYSNSYTAFTTITSNGITTFQFPNSTTPTGTAFRAIRFKISLARGSTNTLSPDLVSLTLIYRKKLETKYGHTVTLDLSKEHKGNSAKALRAALITAIESSTLVEATFRDDSGGTRNYYVDVRFASGMESTGLDERGSTTVVLVEP